ncbi:hypothetical protein SIN09_22610, partial [Streptomyces sp. F8]|nr:hypothetical protein [Streptomyces sp. F8]
MRAEGTGASGAAARAAGASGELTPAARRLYAYAVERHAFDAEEATRALGVRAAAAITELAAAHLLQRAPGGGPQRWSA